MPKGKRLTAQQIMDNYHSGEHAAYADAEAHAGRNFTSDEFWAGKLYEAQRLSGDSSLYQNIEKHGQKKPILINQKDKEIVDGHHRLVSLYHMNPHQFVKYRTINRYAYDSEGNLQAKDA